MSKNSKNAKRHIAARAISEIRKNGGKGPSSTKPLHGKKNAWWQKFRSYGEYINAGKRKPKDA